MSRNRGGIGKTDREYCICGEHAKCSQFHLQHVFV